MKGIKKTWIGAFGVVMATGLSLCLLSVGCSSQTLSSYQHNKPELDMHQFFAGKIAGWGMFQGRGDDVKKRFYVTIDAKHVGSDKIILDEQFQWADGTTSERIWHLTKVSPKQWKGTASDVIGEANGELAGNALHWKYSLKLPVDDTTYDVYFDDWMYLIDDNVMLNRSTMSKWGINLGSVTLSLHKQTAGDNDER